MSKESEECTKINGMPSFVPINGLHHFAYRCRDAEETRHFYEDILGLPLVHVIRQDRVPSTQEFKPHAHIFFRMTDGSCVAFFDLGDNQNAAPSPNTPPWVNHLALRVGSLAELETAQARLGAAGIDVLGPTDHHFVKSIYFFDPNGMRLELTTPVISPSDQTFEKFERQAHEELAIWERQKRGAAIERDKISDGQIEEAEQNAADPSHEKNLAEREDDQSGNTVNKG